MKNNEHFWNAIEGEALWNALKTLDKKNKMPINMHQDWE
jgi:hypothetical protein